MTQLQPWYPAPPAHIQPRGRVQRVSTTYALQHQLRAELKAMRDRGEISAAWGWRVSRKGDYAIAYIDRLRDPLPKWPLRLGAAVVATGAVVGVGVMVWQTRWIWLSLAGFVALVFILIHITTGSGACRCPICGMRLH